MGNLFENAVLLWLEIVSIDESFGGGRHGWGKQEWFTDIYQQVEDKTANLLLVSKRNMKAFIDHVAGTLQQTQREKEQWLREKDTMVTQLQSQREKDEKIIELQGQIDSQNLEKRQWQDEKQQLLATHKRQQDKHTLQGQQWQKEREQLLQQVRQQRNEKDQMRKQAQRQQNTINKQQRQQRQDQSSTEKEQNRNRLNTQLAERLNENLLNCSALLEKNIAYCQLQERAASDREGNKTSTKDEEEKEEQEDTASSPILQPETTRNPRLAQENQTLTRKLKLISEESNNKDTEITQLNSNIDKRKKEIASLTQKLLQQQALAKRLQEQLLAANQEKTAIKQNAERQMDKTKLAASELQLKLDQSETANTNLQLYNDKLNSLLANSQLTLDQLTQTHTRSQQTNTHLKQQTDRLTALLASHDLKIDQLSKRQRQLQDKQDCKTHTLNTTIEALSQDKDIVQSQYDSLMHQFNTLTDTLDRTNTDKLALQNQLHQQKTLRTTLQKQNESQQHRFHKKTLQFTHTTTELQQTLHRQSEQHALLKQQQQHARYHQFFQNEIIQHAPDYKKYIVDELQHRYGHITHTKLVYRLDPLNLVNFHKYVDELPHLIVIVRVTPTVHLAAYTHAPFRKKDHGSSALVFSLQNRSVFSLKPHGKAITYDDFYLIFGNSQIRIKSLEKKIFSNFGIANGYFQNCDKRVDFLLERGKDNEIDIEHYEIYQVGYEKNEKEEETRRESREEYQTRSA